MCLWFFWCVNYFTLISDDLIFAVFIMLYDLTFLSHVYYVNYLRVFLLDVCWLICLTQVGNIFPAASHIESAVDIFLQTWLKTLWTPYINIFPYLLMQILVQNFPIQIQASCPALNLLLIITPPLSQNFPNTNAQS